jgi:hypothetical protein
MEIVNKNAGFLSNYEVYKLLNQIRNDIAIKIETKQSNKLNKKNNTDLTTAAAGTLTDITDKPVLINQDLIDKHLPTIVYESLRYLEKTPCVVQNETVVNNFLANCQQKQDIFKLTKLEKLQLLNQRPTTNPELQVLIEDNEERLTLEQLDELLEFTIQNIPDNREVEETAEEEGEDEELNQE